MSINLNNYEVYLIDYLDGNLSVEVEKELMLFLEKHPEIKSEFENFEEITISDEDFIFDDKDSIKRKKIIATENINENNYEEFFVAFYENDLSESSIVEVLNFVEQNPELEKEFKLHKSLILKSENIVFEDKDKLKKRRTIAIWQYQSLAAAASIAILISFFFFLNNNKPIQKPDYQIGFVDSKNIELNNDLNTSIIDKQIETKVIPQAVVETSFENEILSNNTNKNSTKRIIIDINSIARNKNMYAGLNVTGEIECAKVKYPSQEFIGNNSGSISNDNLLAKIIKKNTQKLANNILPNQANNSLNKKKDPAFVRILQGGITFFGAITGNKVEQLKVYDDDGDLKNYQIDGNTLKMNRQFGPKGAE